MTTPAPTCPKHGTEHMTKLGKTDVCKACQSEITEHLILTLQAQTDNMQNHIVITDVEMERMQ